MDHRAPRREDPGNRRGTSPLAGIHSLIHGADGVPRRKLLDVVRGSRGDVPGPASPRTAAFIAVMLRGRGDAATGARSALGRSGERLVTGGGAAGKQNRGGGDVW
jgi:hypothetical protein